MIITPLPGPIIPPNGGIVPPHLRDPKWNVPKPEHPNPDQPVILEDTNESN